MLTVSSVLRWMNGARRSMKVNNFLYFLIYPHKSALDHSPTEFLRGHKTQKMPSLSPPVFDYVEIIEIILVIRHQLGNPDIYHQQQSICDTGMNPD